MVHCDLSKIMLAFDTQYEIVILTYFVSLVLSLALNATCLALALTSTTIGLALIDTGFEPILG